jgi:hypothetical protein
MEWDIDAVLNLLNAEGNGPNRLINSFKNSYEFIILVDSIVVISHNWSKKFSYLLIKIHKVAKSNVDVNFIVELNFIKHFFGF